MLDRRRGPLEGPRVRCLFQMLFHLSFEFIFAIKFSTFSRLFIRELGLCSWICTGELLQKTQPSGPSTGSCCWFNRGVLNDSLRLGVNGPAQLFVTGWQRIGEDFPAFTYPMVTGTNICSTWNSHLSREVKILAPTDIRY